MDGSGRRLGWTEKGMLGAVFAPLGLVFLTAGLVLWRVGAGEAPEDPLVFLGVFGAVGAVFLLVGLGLLLADLGRRAAQRRAIEGGVYVMARIAGVRLRTNVNAGRTNPRVVECHYLDPDTGVMHVYFSRYLYFDPTDMFTADEVPVYLDRLGGKGAFVDIDAVLPRVVLHT